MPKNYLFIVEGSDEKNVLSDAFEKYGFNVVKCKEKISVDGFGDFNKDELLLNNNNIVVIEGPRNRIHDFLLQFDNEFESIEKLFHYNINYFSGIFLIYDVDHNDNDDIDSMFNKFNDESTGLLLLNVPCLEVLADDFIDDNKYEIKCGHLREYKKVLNVRHDLNGEQNSIEYIKNHFNKIMIDFLEKNKRDFNSTNVMDHPYFVKQKNNSINIRCNASKNSYVHFKYFSTVLYVAIAYANNLTSEIDNYQNVLSFFNK